jgi:hypothetical protein
MKTLLLVASGATGAKRCQAALRMKATTTANRTHRTYSRSDLNKTGQPDTAGAIEAVDPDAQITR